MALKTVSQYKDSVAALLSGVDLSNIDNLYGAFERAARTMIQKADIPEASGIQNITLYGGVYNYACNTTIFGTAITDIRPQGVTRPLSDYVYKRPGQQFDRTKGYLRNGTMTTFEYFNGVPIIRIVTKQTMQQVIIDQMNSTTGWTAAGSASGLTQDNAVYYKSPASLRFTLTGASTGTLTKTLSSGLSLASYQGVGVAFLAIEIPPGATASNLSSISLKLGSSSTNYDLVTNTAGFLGSWVAGEWLLVAFDFSSVITTGTPNWSAINYVQISLTTLGSFTNFRVGNLFFSQPSPAQILFQSAAIFKAANVVASTVITSDDDQILLNDPAYTIFEHEGAIAVLEQTGGAEADSSIARFESKLNGARARNGTVITQGLYDLFRGDNPSQEIRMVGNYYDDNPGNGGAW